MSALAGGRPQLPPVADAPRPPRCSQLWTRSDRRWDRIRHALIIGWLVVIIAMPVTGERTASWSDVRTLISTGQVETVRVSGELGPRATGYSVVEVHWRHGLLEHTAQVVQVQGRSRRFRAAAATDRAPVIHASPSTRLQALHPGLQVTRDQRRTDGGRLLGWQVPNALAISAAGLCVAAFGLLLAGPQPWRATRWAWFWLLLPPVGGIVFLLLSGPTPGIPAPRNHHRRLTGGWAFLLSLPLGQALSPFRW